MCGPFEESLADNISQAGCLFGGVTVALAAIAIVAGAGLALRRLDVGEQTAVLTLRRLAVCRQAHSRGALMAALC